MASLLRRELHELNGAASDELGGVEVDLLHQKFPTVLLCDELVVEDRLQPFGLEVLHGLSDVFNEEGEVLIVKPPAQAEGKGIRLINKLESLPKPTVPALVQVALSGFHLAAWAMLPMTVDHGDALTGVRVEATAFSLFMLVQKVALGLAALLLGLAYAAGGYGGGAADAVGRGVIFWAMVAGPAAMIAAGAAIMALAPLRGRTDQASVNMSDTPSA